MDEHKMTKDEALKLALEALVKTDTEPGSKAWERETEAITAIKQVLEQPEQPKVRTGNCLLAGVCASEGHKIAPQSKPLTDEQIKEIVQNEGFLSLQHFARAIEAAHGIGEKK